MTYRETLDALYTKIEQLLETADGLCVRGNLAEEQDWNEYWRMLGETYTASRDAEAAYWKEKRKSEVSKPGLPGVPQDTTDGNQGAV